ncbi:MAG: hypothetical protein JST00_30420 [Deltaproteobacteria bacterium]|nr:hypothetical protein [Deltaproteobacteria bacterium]
MSDEGSTTTLHWKIRRDPYLRPVCEKHGEAAAIDAGFFWDDDEEDAPLDDVERLCTPFPKLAGRPRASDRRPVVLLSTGAFCPVHDGHLEMMNRARAAAERAGFDVLGGYLSPGHDRYIALKCGPAAIPAYERMRGCAEAVRGSDWLSVDPWEALHRRVSVNYTDVAARLRAYLRRHVDPRIEVLYVCGGDNARFALAFTEEGGCVVVGRPTGEAEAAKWRARLEGHPRILWCNGDHPAASRALRAPVWTPPPRPRVVLRVEDARAVRTLGLSAATHAAFAEALADLVAAHAEVRVVKAGTGGTGSATSAEVDGAVLSLDAMEEATGELRAGTRALAISRLFALGGYEQLGHVARPGSPPLAEQLARIPAGRYVLSDDDQMTGGTIAAVRALLPSSIAITATRFALARDADEDVLDARDFLLGADEGGLVVALPGGETARAIYALPFVDPAVRASTRATGGAGGAHVDPHAFSRAIWSLNAKTFEGSPLAVRDLPSPARALLRQASTPDDMLLSAYCAERAATL